MSTFPNNSGLKEVRGRIVVYSIVGCPHCLKAKSSLQELKLPFTDVSVDRFPARVRDWLEERTGGRTSVPQIFFNETHIGGNEDLQKLIKDQEALDKVLRFVQTFSFHFHLVFLLADSGNINQAVPVLSCCSPWFNWL
jgi:glutaredoxin